jgi:hypothetical protein
LWPCDFPVILVLFWVLVKHHVKQGCEAVVLRVNRERGRLWHAPGLSGVARNKAAREKDKTV